MRPLAKRALQGEWECGERGLLNGGPSARRSSKGSLRASAKLRAAERRADG